MANINLNKYTYSLVFKLDKTKKYFIYCQQGARSSRCMEKMKGMGFTQVYNLLDGYAGYLTGMN